MLLRRRDPCVAILLSTFNGERFLHEQLESLLSQTHEHWVLYWRDDGSTDRTRDVMEAFSRRAGQGRWIEIVGPEGKLGAAASFHALLVAVSPYLAQIDAVALADQDDVWLPQKLARGLQALTAIPDGEPVLYCARQILVDATLQRIGESTIPVRPGGFPASLIQNLATGCTIMLNRAAASLVAASRPAHATWHDWWSYLLVTGAGGRLLQDREPVILYRQHGRNLVGASTSTPRRAIAAIRRGPGAFMAVLRQHVAALSAQPDLLTVQARAEVATLDAALHGGLRRRLAALWTPGLTRQTWPETLLFRCWFLIG
jgi:glycosyltransferase involved in cell wall biosynthesis